VKLKEKILIIDFGSQYTKLIARRVRECKVYCEIYSYKKVNCDFIKNYNPKAIILSGGPSSVTDYNAPDINSAVFDMGIPILGICYGQQLITTKLGGKVELSKQREFGKASLSLVKDCVLFDDIKEKSFDIWMSHGDKVVTMAKDFCVLAITNNAPYAAIANEGKKIYALQFHPEVTHSKYGVQIIKNFLYKVANCSDSWAMGSFLRDKIDEIKNIVGKEQVICGVSGGVDSTVVAVLLHKAIGRNVKCIFVNTGLLRKGEVEQVKDLFSSLDIKLDTIDSEDLFLQSLNGITDPEQKRKIIGKTFIDVFESESKKYGEAKFLAQGTLYSDVIESSVGEGASATIKSHHNVGGLPRKMNLKLLEPLKEIFKDEVRELGKELGIPSDILNRHPFPGPGLAVRIIGEITKEKIRILREVDYIYLTELHKNNLYDKIWQAFAVLLSIKSVGVMGDGRSYEYVCALRAVNSFDGMTADIYHFPYDFLCDLSNKIVNNVKGVNRVTYDITSKPPSTIEWE
jgi:GMP synthase (glutamine-hydrolysing)